MNSKNTPENTQKTNRDYWLEQINQCNISKLSQKLYCSKEGLNYNTFVYWRGQFKRSPLGSNPKKFLPLKVKREQDTTPDIAQLIKVKLLSGNVIYIPTAVGMQEIAILIRSLELSHA